MTSVRGTNSITSQSHHGAYFSPPAPGQAPTPPCSLPWQGLPTSHRKQGGTRRSHFFTESEAFKVGKSCRDNTFSKERVLVPPGGGGPVNMVTSHFCRIPEASLQNTWSSMATPSLIAIIQTKKQVWGGDMTPPYTPTPHN